MKIQRVEYKPGKYRYHITLNKDIVEKKQWEKGTELTWIFNERGNVELTDDLKKKG